MRLVVVLETNLERMNRSIDRAHGFFAMSAEIVRRGHQIGPRTPQRIDRFVNVMMVFGSCGSRSGSGLRVRSRRRRRGYDHGERQRENERDESENRDDAVLHSSILLNRMNRSATKFIPPERARLAQRLDVVAPD